jgi:hypothetical protein
MINEDLDDYENLDSFSARFLLSREISRWTSPFFVPSFRLGQHCRRP